MVFSVYGFSGGGWCMEFTTIVIKDLERLKMDKVSKNFSRSEFACKCKCGFATVDIDLLNVLEVVRKKFNRPVKINSACRCESHNENINGSYGSKHKQGIAADIVVKSVSPDDVYAFLDLYQPNKYGVGKYKTFTHIDVRQTKARWQG